jgi:hypothetical protein
MVEIFLRDRCAFDVKPRVDASRRVAARAGGAIDDERQSANGNSSA